MKFFTKRQITSPDGSVYMKRNTLFECRWFSIKIHKIIRGDWANDLHNHPWSFITFILWSGYNEVTSDGEHWRKPFVFYYRPAGWRHRVKTDRPVWTVVLTGPKRHKWGFWTDDGFVPWKEYCDRYEFKYPKEN